MADIEITTDEAEHPPPRRLRGSTTRWGIVATAAVLAITFGVIIFRAHHAAAPTAASPTGAQSTPSVVAPPNEPSSGSDGPDALVYTGIFAESGSLGSSEVTYIFDLVNESAMDLTISYPIKLVGAGDIAIVPVFAGIYDQANASSHINDLAPPANRLLRIPAGLSDALMIRLHIDCENNAMTQQTPDSQPVVQIQVAGFTNPAKFGFSNLAGGFDDTVRQVCGG